MNESLTTYLIAIFGVVGLMTGWILIQALWRKIFAGNITDSDVLAERRSCGNCGCTTVCSRENGVKIKSEHNKH
ncbi:hypothetical protein [Fulvivirga sedimenti]|uniref:FeoB-associated Cys-rich membrane protein n=1 Tax=Fulvivirga sedimenti TaxID=2879465 RepID=A0A9X1HPW9_9BACT|nr:hypothetical protein [Fulvivirga sedimenti]MCA6074032.1 hypothetical protein [Fulvivirga sedimenti]